MLHTVFTIIRTKKMIQNILSGLERKNKFAFYFSLFRIFLCIILLKDIVFCYPFIDILFKGTSFVEASPVNVLEFFNVSSTIFRQNIPLFLSIYTLLIFLLFFGIGGNITMFLVYLFYEINQGLSPFIQNGGDNLLKFVMLYMIFADSFQYFSVEKIKPHSSISNFLSNLAGHSVQIHICLVYFISAIHKVHAEVWFNGIATYYTLSLERFRGTDMNLSLAKNGIFVTFSTYFTLFFELLFPLAIWNKSLRNIFMLSGILIHIGIFFFMMIYDFQVIFIMIYGFFISNNEWITLTNKIKNYIPLNLSLKAR